MSVVWDIFNFVCIVFALWQVFMKGDLRWLALLIMAAR